MTISVLQSITFSGAWSGSFGGNVTAGSTVYLIPYCYGGSAMASSAPKFNGSAVGTATALLSGQNTAGNSVYSAIWQLPSLAGGAASVSLTNSGNGTVDGNVGMAAIEVAGLGVSPAADSGASPNPESANGNTGAVTSGSTGAITSSPQFILATAVAYGQNVAGPASPWTNLFAANVGFIMAGWQIAASSGGAYDYSVTSAATAGWFAGAVTIAPSGGAPALATPSPLIVPSQAAIRAASW